MQQAHSSTYHWNKLPQSTRVLLKLTHSNRDGEDRCGAERSGPLGTIGRPPGHSDICQMSMQLLPTPLQDPIAEQPRYQVPEHAPLTSAELATATHYAPAGQRLAEQSKKRSVACLAPRSRIGTSLPRCVRFPGYPFDIGSRCSGCCNPRQAR